MKVKQLKRKIILIALIISMLLPYIPAYMPVAKALTTHQGEAQISSSIDMANNRITFKVEKVPYYDSLKSRRFQWQYSTNNGVAWNDISGATGETLTIDNIKEKKGTQYRCIVYSKVANAEAIFVDAYRAFLHRNPEPEGYKYWTELFANITEKNKKKVEYESEKLNGNAIHNDAVFIACCVVLSHEYMIRWAKDIDTDAGFYFTYENNQYVRSD